LICSYPTRILYVCQLLFVRNFLVILQVVAI
jgi:hypothetical protein